MREAALTTARILIVDDQPVNVRLLERILRQAGFTELHSLTDSREVLAQYAAIAPDLLLLDLHMPPPDGFTLLEQLRATIPTHVYFPILVLTADSTPETKQRALTLGAKDFLTKPFDAIEVILRARNLLDSRFLHLEQERHSQLLEGKVRERTRELEEAQVEILARLARAAEYRDDDTGQHTQRVGRLSALLARALGLPDTQVELLRRAAPLHDLGKIGIPDRVLLKPGKLSADEFAAMQAHATIGADILTGSRYALLRLATELCHTHHERWDGTGYPRGLREEEIPLAGRIVAVVDVFDALTHERPYKPAWSVPEAVAELERQQGKQFDPRVVAAFLRVLADEGVYPTGAAPDTPEREHLAPPETSSSQEA